MDVLFLETPHRLHVELSPEGRTFTAQWETEPLHDGTLGELRAPR